MGAGEREKILVQRDNFRCSGWLSLGHSSRHNSRRPPVTEGSLSGCCLRPRPHHSGRRCVLQSPSWGKVCRHLLQDFSSAVLPDLQDDVGENVGAHVIYVMAERILCRQHSLC